MYRDTCLSFGPDDDVGLCNAGCDPLLVQGCNPADANNADCHVSYLTGEGYCDVQNTMAAATGGPCMSDSDCAPGYGCLTGKCWKYCNDKTAATACAMGATCKQLEGSTVPTSIVGICSMSK
jgi:hypothetical protein